MTVLDLLMTAGGLPVESFSYSAERGTGERLDVTVIGDTRGQPVPAISVQAGGQGAVFLVGGTLPEWEAERDALGWTTTLHATDRALIPSESLPELVPWEAQGDRDARTAQERALKVAKVPPAHRAAALRDGRRMAVDAVVSAALATVPHRLLTPAPWPGYDFRADGGPSYRTEGKTAAQVVQDLWGMLGITAGWEGGLLTIRPPGPAGDLILAAPIGSERIERITLDAPALELTGGVPSDVPDDGGTDDNPDPDAPTDPDNSPDPDERDGNPSGGFSEGFSPTPVAGELSAYAVPLSWEGVPNASQYVLERIEGFASPYTLWSRIAITTATRTTDDTVRPLTTYSYRLTVNATAIAGSETQNVIWQPSGILLLTTPPPKLGAPPAPVTDLEGYWRSSTGVAVKWTPPLADPPDGTPPLRGPADRYRVDVNTTAATPVLLRRVETHLTYAVADGLPVGALVDVTVQAINAQGISEKATARVQLVNLPPAGATAPEVTVSGAVLSATWERVSGATSYDAQYAYAPLGTLPGGLLWRTLPTVRVPPEAQDGAGSRPTVIIPGLDFETRYAVRVAGRNDLGLGAYSPVVYAVTESFPPRPEPDPEADSFERASSQTLRFYRSTPTESETTVLVKQGGRIVSTVVDLWGNVPLYARKPGPDGEKIVLSTSWKRLKKTTTRYFYEIAEWPLTLTGRVEETELYGTEEVDGGSLLNVSNPLIGTEQEKVHQEWSPQGWLNRRFTTRSKAAVLKVQRNDAGAISARKYGNQHEFVTERWQPVGDGLWFYQRSGVYTALLPTLTDGEWEDLEPGFKATPSESSVSEQGPEQAVLPREKQEAARQSGAPPLTRNTSSPAVDAYPLDAPWFTATDAPPGPGAPPDEGEPGSGPGEPPSSPYDPPTSPGTGSGDPSGQPGPDLPPKTAPRDDPITLTRPGPSETAPVLSATVPWVRTAQGLARAAAVMAQVGGPRFRITRSYLLPVTPPSLDLVESISASGDRDQFSMTVVTLTR